MFLVPVGDGLGELFQLLAVVEFDLSTSSEDVLELCHDALLDLQTSIETFELVVQL